MEGNDDGWEKMLQKHKARRTNREAGKILSYLAGSNTFLKIAAVVSLIFFVKLVFWFFGIRL